MARELQIDLGWLLSLDGNRFLDDAAGRIDWRDVGSNNWAAG